MNDRKSLSFLVVLIWLAVSGIANAADIHLPTAQPVAVSVANNTPIEITLSAVDNFTGNGPISFTFAITSLPMHGTLGVVNGDQVRYTPVPGYVGADSFSYNATDVNGESADAPVSIAVTAAAPASIVALPTLQTWGMLSLAASLVGFAYWRRKVV